MARPEDAHLTTEHRARLYRRYLSALYEESNPIGGSEYHRRLTTLRDLLLPLLPQDRDAQIADLGCGIGSAVEMLIAQGYRNVQGVDASEEQVMAARRRNLPVAHENIFEFLAAHRGVFDVLLALDVIEHLSRGELLEFLDLVVVALRPKGRLIVKTANANAPTASRMRFKDLTHELIFTEQSLRMAFSVTGLRPVAIYGERPRPASIAGLARGVLAAITRRLWRLFLIAELGREGLRIPVEFNLIAIAEKPPLT